MSILEIDRINRSCGIQDAPDLRWRFQLDLGNDPVDAMNRIIGVVRQIASHEPDDWPEDDFWKSNLPVWLLEYLPELTRDEAERELARTPRAKWDELPWELGSWLDAIHERAWTWWGHEIRGRIGEIVLGVIEIPPRIDAFKQILLAANVEIICDVLE